MGGLSQTTCAKFLRRAQTDAEVEEILGAYVHAKQARARNAAQVERKLSLLGYYLNAVGQGEQTIRHARAFATVSSFARMDIAASHVVFPSTSLGVEVWNEARRSPTGWFGRARAPRMDAWSPVSSSASSFV
ncbi:hypothetical protein JCM10212_004113 [Sporobolomyces blumeae]